MQESHIHVSTKAPLQFRQKRHYSFDETATTSFDENRHFSFNKNAIPVSTKSAKSK
jgi:hypothetical protein